jgi:predicted glutamine amidotransferase
MLGYVSPMPQTFPEVMGDEWDKFVSLSQQHADGWGIAWRDAETGLIRLTKAPNAAFGSADFRIAAESIRTRMAALHFRWASPGLCISYANTHPFWSSDHTAAFMHNGAVEPVDRIWADVSVAAQTDPGHGVTDSEAYWRLWESHVARGHSFTQAFEEVMQILRSWSLTYTGLNAMIVTPQQLYVVSEYDVEAVLAQNDPEYYTLYQRQVGGATVIASSGWAMKNEWLRVPHHTLTTIACSCSVRIERVPLLGSLTTSRSKRY